MLVKCMFSGSGGQGSALMAKLVCEGAMRENLKVVMTQTYGIEQRGGDSTAFIIISDEAIGSPIVENDATIAVALSQSIYEQCLHGVAPGGNLYPIKNTVSNLLGALGGILLPIALFFSLNAFFGSPDYHNGWAIPTATDVAISLLFAQMIFGKKHPAFTFLLLLAIADDVVGLAIIALFYPDPELPVNPRWLSLVFVAVAVAWILNKHKVRSYWAYLLTGILSWAGLHEANMHPSLALIFIIPFIPHETEPGKERCQTELDRFESDFKPIVDYGLFFFGLSNAGVVFSSISELTLIVFVSLLAGKTFGIYLMVKIAGLFKFRINNAITDLDLLLIGMTAGIGLTVSLFIAEIAYTDGSIADVADGQRRELAADTPVSMNFWGFMPSVFPALRTYFEDFLRALPADALKAECLLPVMVGEELKAGRIEVSVLHSKDKWFGMTYHEDRQAVAQELARLHENGTYPATLRN